MKQLSYAWAGRGGYLANFLSSRTYYAQGLFKAVQNPFLVNVHFFLNQQKRIPVLIQVTMFVIYKL